jgi:iron complex transport system ATP-binding protein
MIEAIGVSKRYGETVVVDGVTLRLPKGGVTAIIGPNGAGKSSLLSMIARLLPISAGQVRVDGLDVARTPGAVLAKRLSILRQDNHLPARLTVRDLVAFGRYPHSGGRPTREDAAHVERALRYLALEGLAERFLDELSGGQRQRAFVAMVLAQDTDYVLLDEPLNSLDMQHAVAMMRLVRRAAEELGKTVVLVLHDLNFASCHADHIVAMRDGRVLMQGSPAAIMTPEAIAAIYDVEATVHEIGGRLIAAYFA